MVAIINFKTKVSGVSASQLRAVFKKAYEDTARYWHKHMLPKHFTRAGAIEYGYTKRTEKYMKRKAKKWGHQDPLVYSGNLRDRAKLTRDIRANSKQGKVVMRGLPSYVFKYYNSSPVKKHLELVKASEREKEILRRVYQASINKHFSADDKTPSGIVSFASTA